MASLGIDTSCYTTSVALTQGAIVLADLRTKLEVEAGGLGLRQSEALFRHIKNLPGLVEEAFLAARREGVEINSVAASAWPRRKPGSYMPVFIAGASGAASIAAALGLKVSEVSHQEGHIAACAKECGLSKGDKFLAVHISGGTTEVLRVEWTDIMKIDVLSESSDISAGQMVDRVGSLLGLGFPAGQELEVLADGATDCGFRLPSSVVPGKISFSGPCEAAARAIRKGVGVAQVARSIELCIVRSISKSLKQCAPPDVPRRVLIVGGVASNGRIRSGLEDELDKYGLEALFGKKELSSDNAVGVAFLGEELK